MEHDVVLVPGFLGFKRVFGLTYFARDFVARLERELASRSGEKVRVVAVDTLPIGSLAERQSKLLSSLRRLRGSDPKRALHLVGHSTGGLDASFLTRTHRLTSPEQGRSRFSAEPLAVPGLRSVTTIATPHYGTTLALAPLAQMTIAHPSAAGTLELVELLGDVLASRDATGERLRFALGSFAEGRTLDFLAHLFFNNRLARDLAPEVVKPLTDAPNVRNPGDIPVFSIATWAPRPNDEVDDALFTSLWNWTAQSPAACADAPPRFPPVPAHKLIRSANAPHPGSPQWSDSDGVVNTERQVFGTFAGLVVADHGDVIGRYRRYDPVEKRNDPGLLTSGAKFDDETFARLVSCVADGIVATIAAQTIGTTPPIAAGTSPR